MPDKKLLNLAWKNVFPTANNHLFEPSYNIYVAVSIHCRQVTGMQPSRAINGLSSFFRHIVVATHDQVATATEFAALTRGNGFTRGRMYNFYVHVRQGYPHCR